MVSPLTKIEKVTERSSTFFCDFLSTAGKAVKLVQKAWLLNQAFLLKKMPKITPLLLSLYIVINFIAFFLFSLYTIVMIVMLSEHIKRSSLYELQIVIRTYFV